MRNGLDYTTVSADQSAISAPYSGSSDPQPSASSSQGGRPVGQSYHGMSSPVSTSAMPMASSCADSVTSPWRSGRMPCSSRAETVGSESPASHASLRELN